VPQQPYFALILMPQLLADELSSRVRDYLKELAEVRAWIYTPPQALLFLIQIGGA